MIEQLFKSFETQVKDIDQKGRITVAANALGNIDAVKDMSMEGSFKKTLNDNFSRLRWFLNHDKNILLGVPIEGKEVFPYLQMTGQLNMNKEISRDVYEDYKLYAEYDRSLEHSVGVSPVKKSQENGIRKVYEWKMWEYSTLTHWGCNSDTPALSIKSLTDPLASIDWLELKLRKGNFTDKKFLEIEQTLNRLKSLVAEPGTPTLKLEPKIKDAFAEFRKSLH